MSDVLLDVRGLSVEFDTPDGVLRAVDGISFSVERGRTFGIVGESGAGKSVVSRALLGLTRFEGGRAAGTVSYAGRDLVGAPEADLRALRGDEIAMIFQDPLAAMHPLRRVGAQIGEAIRAHRETPRRAAWARAVELLEHVGIRAPARAADAYPHELSGGMRQRAMIAMALANGPRLLIADEPTTALDVTVQAQIIDLIRSLQAESGMAVVIVSHDLDVIAEIADDVAVMYAGRIVERAPAAAIFDDPQHPYTWGLLRSAPRLDTPREQALVPIPGQPPSPLDLPPGCAFHPRCPYVRERHRSTVPALEAVPGAPGHSVACLLEPAARGELWSRLRAGAS